MKSEDYWSINLGYIEPTNTKHKIKMNGTLEQVLGIKIYQNQSIEEILYDIDNYADNILEGLESEENIIEETHKIKNALRKLGVLSS